MKEYKFRITYVKDNEVKVKMVEETKEELKERIDYYIAKGYVIWEVAKEEIIVNYKPIDYEELK